VTLLAILLGLIIMGYLTSPFIVILHELGHALAYLIFTKPERIDVYIGSYGEEQKAFKVKLGKLQFYIRKSFPFAKMIGLCKSSKLETNPYKDICILLAGPVFTLLSASVFFFVAVNLDIHGAIKFYCFGLVICSFISLINNLRPSTIKSARFGEIDNDGKQILFAWTMRKAFTQYYEAVAYISKEEFKEAADILNAVSKQVKLNEKLLRICTDLSFYNKSFESFIYYTNQLKKIAILNSTDYVHRGYAYSMEAASEPAILEYQLALKLDNKNQYALNNLAYEYIRTEQFEKAKNLLNKCIKLYPNFSNPYSNLGYLHTLLDELDVAKEYLDKGIALEPNEPYQYLHLGVYHLKREEPELAITALLKCRDLDSTIQVQNYLDEADDMLTRPKTV
jgi:predicted Zn-dependent protease